MEFFLGEPDFSETDEQGAAARDAQRDYITSYLQKTEDALFADGMTDSEGVPYGEYLDLQSSAAYWWVQEFSLNDDAFLTPSTYLYKKRDGKLYWGPLWDFDLAFETFHQEEDYGSLSSSYRMKWLDHMRANDARYRELLLSTWNRLDGIVDGITAKGGILDQYATELKTSWIANRMLLAAEYEEGDFTESDAEGDFNRVIDELRQVLLKRQEGVRAALGESGENLADVCVKVQFLVDGQVVKTSEVRRDEDLDDYDFPPIPERDGFYFQKWEDADGKEVIAGDRGFSEDSSVHAVFIPDDEVTKPNGLFFRFPDKWVTTDYGTSSAEVFVTPGDVIARRLTWTSSDPDVASPYRLNGMDLIRIKKPGEAEITCTSVNGLSASFTLHVVDSGVEIASEIEDFHMESDRLVLDPGQFGQIPAIVSNASRGTLFYESSDTSIAAPFGPVSGVIEAIAPGKCTITVRNMSGSVERQYTVVVTNGSADDAKKTDLSKAKGNKKITVNEKSGKVTVKRGLKRGTYEAKVKVTAAGNANYKKLTRTVAFRIIVSFCYSRE